jgi:hypothetical protein
MMSQDERVGSLMLAIFHMATRPVSGCSRAPHGLRCRTPSHLRSGCPLARFAGSSSHGQWGSRVRPLQSVAWTVGETRTQSHTNDAFEKLDRMIHGFVFPQRLGLIRSYGTVAGQDTMAWSDDVPRSSKRHGA